jgi:tetratricopeptide (TPR) repeat protein
MQHGLAKLEDLQGHREQAAELLQDIVNREPMQAYYLTELGLQLRSLRRWPEALEAFRRAQKLKNSELIEINIQLLERKMAAPPA